MANSTGKVLGLVLLIPLVLLMLFFLAPAFFIPFRVFGQIFHSLPSVVGMHALVPQEMFFLRGAPIIPLALLILWIFVIIWVYQDAEQRGLNGLLWALLVFVGNIIGLLIYLIVRNDSATKQLVPKTTEACPKCSKPVLSSYAFCPYCGNALQAVCPSCKESVDSSWRVCPHCGKRLPD